MEIGEVLKKPFGDVGKLLIGSVLGIIPIVNLTVMGYGLDNYKKPKKLPEFEFEQFVTGLKAAILGLIYFLIPAILVVASLGMNNLSLTVVAGLLALAFIPASTVALIYLVKKGSLKDGLEFNKVFKVAYRETFLIPWLVSSFLAFAVSFVLNLVPYLGWLVSGYVATVVYWTYLGSRVKV